MIIEDESFSLGMPTPMEMLEQHALLLEGENEQLQHHLSHARNNIGKLMEINLGQANQITQLNDRIKQLSRDLSSAYVEISELKNRQLTGRPSTWGDMPPTGDSSSEVNEADTQDTQELAADTPALPRTRTRPLASNAPLPRLE